MQNNACDDLDRMLGFESDREPIEIETNWLN